MEIAEKLYTKGFISVYKINILFLIMNKIIKQQKI